MKIKVLSLLLIIFSLNVFGLTIEDIVKLSQAQVSDEIILKVIEVSDIKFKITSDEIIRLKNQGVSQNVILGLLKIAKKNKEEKREEKKLKEVKSPEEFSPFDQFFLSPYYSTQYGWPAPYYTSPRKALEMGLLKPYDVQYPWASRVRIRGFGYSYKFGPGFNYTYSPYSIIVPRNQVQYYRNRFPNINIIIKKEK